METLEDLEKEFERLQQPRRKKIYTPKIYPTKTKEQIQKEFEEDYKIVLEKDYNKSIILNCIIDSDYCLPVVPPGNALNDMVTYNNINKFIFDKTLAPS